MQRKKVELAMVAKYLFLAFVVNTTDIFSAPEGTTAEVSLLQVVFYINKNNINIEGNLPHCIDITDIHVPILCIQQRNVS